MRRPDHHPCAPTRRPGPSLATLSALPVVTLFVAGCSGSCKSATSTTKKATTTTGQALTPSVHPPAGRPMQPGIPPPHPRARCPPPAAARLTTDLPAFGAPGLPAAPGPVTAKTATIVLTGLAQQDSSVVMVDA